MAKITNDIDQNEKKLTIKDARKLIGLSQTKASKVLGIPVKTLQNWEQEIRTCPDWIREMAIEKLFDYDQEDYERNRDKYMKEFLENNYTVVYKEYDVEKTMEVDATGGVDILKKELNYWQGAYGFERCTAPIILFIKDKHGKNIMVNFIEIFNKKSIEINNYVLPEMDHQNMDWAKPRSTKELIKSLKGLNKSALE